jgi:uncharacterized protein (DUF927 family)
MTTLSDLQAATGRLLSDNQRGAFELDTAQGLTHWEEWRTTEDNKISKYRDTRICDYIEVVAITSNQQGNDWGRLVKFKDERGIKKELFIPLNLLVGNALELGAMLMESGLVVKNSTKARQLLTDYLTLEKNKPHCYTSDKIGWHDNTYLLPDRAISPDKAPVLRYKANGEYPEFKQRGSLEDWINGVSIHAIGNSRMLFALSLAFAAPLSRLAGFGTCIGFHYRGSSRSGKTTLAKCAVSVYGNYNELIRTWNSTAGALEGTASSFNDNLLLLDEISQSHDPLTVYQTIYALGNGIEKGRLKATGGNRPLKHWHLLYFSTGEESLATMMAKVKRKPNAGTEMRFIDLDADAGKGFGAFDVLTTGKNAGELSNLIQANAKKYHGTAGNDWISYITKHKQTIESDILPAIEEFEKLTLNEHATAQHRSTCAYFGLIAFAGEIATAQGFTGWNKGDATHAAHIMFNNWLDNFGHRQKESQNVIDQVTAFIAAHGGSRFEPINSDGMTKVSNRAGFVRTNAAGELEYLVFPTEFKSELIVGCDQKTSIKTLIESGMLHPDKEGKASQIVNISALGKSHRFYVITLMKDY